jgi:hypothetical protein
VQIIGPVDEPNVALEHLTVHFGHGFGQRDHVLRVEYPLTARVKFSALRCAIHFVVQANLQRNYENLIHFIFILKLTNQSESVAFQFGHYVENISGQVVKEQDSRFVYQ